jgi:hypothetical protein
MPLISSRMLKGVCLILLLGAAGHAAAQSLPSVRCKAAGSWGCSPEGACIDGPAHRGERYRIDFKRMIIRGPAGRMSMQPGNAVGERKDWPLIGGGHLLSRNRIHPRGKHRDYDTYWLFTAGEPNAPIELWCAV